MLPGGSFYNAVDDALAESRCVVVLWSSSSVRSDWVRSEAERGMKRGVLVPVLIEDIQPPLPFTSIECAELAEWRGNTSNTEFRNLVLALSEVLGPPPCEPEPYDELSPPRATPAGRARTWVFAVVAVAVFTGLWVMGTGDLEDRRGDDGSAQYAAADSVKTGGGPCVDRELTSSGPAPSQARAEAQADAAGAGGLHSPPTGRTSSAAPSEMATFGLSSRQSRQESYEALVAVRDTLPSDRLLAREIEGLISVLELRAEVVRDLILRESSDSVRADEVVDRFNRCHELHIAALRAGHLVLAHEMLISTNAVLAKWESAGLSPGGAGSDAWSDSSQTNMLIPMPVLDLVAEAAQMHRGGVYLDPSQPEKAWIYETYIGDPGSLGRGVAQVAYSPTSSVDAEGILHFYRSMAWLLDSE